MILRNRVPGSKGLGAMIAKDYEIKYAKLELIQFIWGRLNYEFKEDDKAKEKIEKVIKEAKKIVK